MKFDLQSIDQTQFMVHPHVLNNEIVHLAQPQHIGCKWNQENKFLRSVVLNEDGEVISIGFPKFTNWGENTDHFPTPNSLKDVVCVEKLDGSLLVVSKYKGKFILRTRGTVDASKLDNGYELEVFKQKYPLVFEYQPHFETWPFSLLFEWTSPENRIVIRYGDEPEFSLVGAVYHDNGKLWTQDWLDGLAKGFGCPRPEVYSFKDISDLLVIVDGWVGKEGVVAYSNGGQMLHKVKSADYLVKHRLKEEFCNFERVLDFYIAQQCPDFKTFQEKVSQITDWETATEIVGDISRCVDAQKEVGLIIAGMLNFVEKVCRQHNWDVSSVQPIDKKTRAFIAKDVLAAYGNTNRASFVFKCLDKKPFGNDDLKKLYFQVLKK
jgi:hypothetical protein